MKWRSTGVILLACYKSDVYFLCGRLGTYEHSSTNLIEKGQKQLQCFQVLGSTVFTCNRIYFQLFGCVVYRKILMRFISTKRYYSIIPLFEFCSAVNETFHKVAIMHTIFIFTMMELQNEKHILLFSLKQFHICFNPYQSRK